MTTFLETPRFPTGISYGSQGGPEFLTDIVPLRSGKTIRNKAWGYPLHKYNVLTGIKREAQLEEVREYFYAVAGRAYGFRYKDFSDWKSCALGDTPAYDDQTIGTGDGSTAAFQLKKTYTKGALSQERLIQKPVAGTWLIGVAGALVTSGYTMATGTGIFTFATGSVPTTGQAITAGFEFDVPCEFGTDYFNVVIEDCNATTQDLLFNVDSLPLGEIRL